jgi:hypothetical protein
VAIWAVEFIDWHQQVPPARSTMAKTEVNCSYLHFVKNLTTKVNGSQQSAFSFQQSDVKSSQEWTIISWQLIHLQVQYSF